MMKIHLKTFTFLVIVFTPVTILFGQTKAFEGVFVSQEPPLVIAIKSINNSMNAYITDGAILEPVSCTWQDPTLIMVAKNNPAGGSSFASLDANNNLWVTDEQFNTVFFTRSEESLDAVWKELESAYSGTTSPTPADPSQNSSNAAGYANKKFLHLYTGNGYTEKWAYYLYENGTFYFRSSNSYASGGYYDFSAATSGNDGGTYVIEKKSGQEYLTLRWNNGNQGSLKITKTEQGYLLNNEKYYLVGLNEYD